MNQNHTTLALIQLLVSVCCHHSDWLLVKSNSASTLKASHELKLGSFVSEVDVAEVAVNITILNSRLQPKSKEIMENDSIPFLTGVCVVIIINPLSFCSHLLLIIRISFSRLIISFTLHVKTLESPL